MSAWDLLPCVIIWAPLGSALGHPYNYTRQQIPCSDVITLQLLHVHVCPVVQTVKDIRLKVKNILTPLEMRNT